MALIDFPTLHDGVTVESIKQEMLAGLTNIETREGSVMNTLISGISAVIWQLYMHDNSLLEMAFPGSDGGIYLDADAAKWGFVRKKGTKATATLTFTDCEGVVIPAGMSFATADGLFFYLEDRNSPHIVTGDADAVTVVAAENGSAYNVAEGEIVQPYTYIHGLEWTASKATGGTDDETDESLFERLDEYRTAFPVPASYAYYREMVMGLDGVGNCVPIGRWDGPGTVKLVIADSTGAPASETLVAAVQEYVSREDVRDLCIEPTVVSADALSLTVAAELEIDTARTSEEEATAAFRAALVAYLLGEAMEEQEVKLSSIIRIGRGLTGVTDITGVTLNGSGDNVPIGETEVPVLDELTVEVV